MFNYCRVVFYIEVVVVALVSKTRSLGSFEVEAKYSRVARIGDRLEELNACVDWKALEPLLQRVRPLDNVMGRPAYENELLLKMLVLQEWYGLSDEQIEYQVADRFSFQKFLGFPETIPDYTTLWKFREAITKAGVEQELLDKLNEQLSRKGIKVRKGVIQDATIITADPGKKRLAELKKESEKGGGVSYTTNQLAHMDLDASSTKKNGSYEYGYKAHVKCDAEHQLIQTVEVTTASVHDSQVHLEEEDDGPVYRDRGYAGTPLECRGVTDKTMHKRKRGQAKLPARQQEQNRAFSKIRCLGERPFAVIKRVFHAGHVYVKTLSRVTTHIFMRCFAYNIYRSRSLMKASA